MDHLAAMRLFVRVVERGSMSAAARDLGIGQPAVSERIERLEGELGTRLLRRSTRALSTTDTGAAFFERAKLAIEAADDALAVTQTTIALRGTIRIAAPHSLGETLLAPALLSLRKDHPALRIDLVLNDRIVDPVTEGVDISLRLGDPGQGSFVARRLGHVNRVLVAAPEYLERHGTPREPVDLAHHAFARVSGLFGGDKLALLSRDGRTVTAPLDVALAFGHWRPLHAVLLGGGAIGVLQAPVCADDLTMGRLKQLLPDFTVPGFDLHALYAAGRPVAPRIKAVLCALETQATRILVR